MKRIHVLVAAAVLVVVASLLFAPGGLFAVTKVGVPQFPAGIAVGDNYAEDTLWVMGHIKIDSSGSYATMTLTGVSTISDSLYIPATAGTFFGKGSTISADSSLIFSFSGTKGRLKVLGAVLGVDSVRVVKKIVAEDGAVCTFDTVAITDGQFWPKGTPIFGDSVVFFKNTRIDADSMSIKLRLQARDNSVALLDSVRVDDGTSFAANSKVWGSNTLVFTGMRPVMDSVSLGSKVRVSANATMYGDNNLTFSGGKLSVDTLALAKKMRITKKATIYPDSVFTLSGGRMDADSLKISTFARFGANATIYGDNNLTLSGGKLTVDTLAITNLARITQGATIYIDSSIAFDGGYVVIDTIGGLTRARLATDATFYGDSTIQFSGARLQMDSAVVGHEVRFNKDGGLIGDSAIIISNAVLSADSARVAKIVATNVTAAGTSNFGEMDAETLTVGSDEVYIPMVFQAESLAVNQTVAIWSWPRDYTVKTVQINSLTAPDDTMYVEILMDTLDGARRDTVMIKGAEKAKTFTPTTWFEESAEGCTLRTFLGSGTKGALKGNIILWLKLR